MTIPTPTQPTEAPKSKSLRRTLLGVGGATLFLLGIGVGGADSQPAPAPAALPAVTTTATVTESVSVPETPKVCTEALDKADTLLDLASQGFTHAQDALNGAASFDVDAINKATKGLQKLNPKVEAARSDYDTAASACRSN